MLSAESTVDQRQNFTWWHFSSIIPRKRSVQGNERRKESGETSLSWWRLLRSFSPDTTDALQISHFPRGVRRKGPAMWVNTAAVRLLPPCSALPRRCLIDRSAVRIPQIFKLQPWQTERAPLDIQHLCSCGGKLLSSRYRRAKNDVCRRVTGTFFLVSQR